MPVLSGKEAVAALRRLGRTDFVVGITGTAFSPGEQEAFLHAGADCVLTKPIGEKSVERILELALVRGRA
ncbi:hypothetical protein BD413DRAFT_539275 [Trametes elegans]|nr:hypothetical protein BD413DRAFT_539275 [Trametes elegans]